MRFIFMVCMGVFMGLSMLSAVESDRESVDAAHGRSRLIHNLDQGKKQVLVAFGTSLTANVNTNPRGGWVAQVETTLKHLYSDKITVVNLGGPGKESRWGIKNVKRVVAARPDTVLIEFSINDAVDRFNLSLAESRSNTLTIIEAIRAELPECEIILMSMTPAPETPKRGALPQYYQVYRDLGKEHQIKVIDIYPIWKMILDRSEEDFLALVPDHIHPSWNGMLEVTTPAVLNSLGVKYDQELLVQQKQ